VQFVGWHDRSKRVWPKKTKKQKIRESGME
jgi:hypothetical protein